MSYPDPSCDLFWVRIDSYTADAGDAVREAIDFALARAAVPDGLRARVYGVELEANDAPSSVQWTVYVTLVLYRPLSPEEIESRREAFSRPRQDAPRWRRLLR